MYKNTRYLSKKSYFDWGFCEVDKRNLVKFLLQKDDILVARTGASIGVNKLITEKMNAVFNNGLIRLRVDPSKIESIFLYYNMQSERYKSHIHSISGGTSTQPNMKMNALLDFEIELPSLLEQHSISSILKSLDDKIELNKKINKILEEMAQVMFKNWFVEFEPFKDGKFVESELGMIPVGWEVKKLGDFFPVVTGKKNANVSSSKGKYPFFSCSQDIAWTNSYSFDGSAILVAGNGDFSVKWYEGKFEAYQRTYVLVPFNERLTGLLYYMIKHFLATITSGHRGSVINFITKGSIEDFKVILPNDLNDLSIIDTFRNIIKMIDHYKKENRTLENIRDTMLPRLMSGELRIPLTEV